MAQTQQDAKLAIAWGPVLSDLTPTSVRVAWATSIPARSRIIASGIEVRSPQRKIYHEVKVTGLKPGYEYTYVVQAFAGAQRAEAGPYKFRTPPVDLREWTFVAFGDTRSRYEPHKQVIQAILNLARRPWLALHTGDLVSDGRKKEHWDKFFEVERPLLATVAFYPCLGNHERESHFYYDIFPVPRGGGPQDKAWYSFEFGGALFVVLDSEIDLAPQTKFLEEKLAEADRRGIRWRFVTWHEPPYSSGAHGGNGNIQRAWVPVLERHGATAVFCGHDHIYEHSVKKGIHYFVAGGGGAPLYPVGLKPNPYSVKAESTLNFVEVLVRPDLVRFTAYRPDGSIIEQFEVR